jgi:hypothetical protein
MLVEAPKEECLDESSDEEEEFTAEGDMESMETRFHIKYEILRCPDLRDACKTKSLKKGGKKAELIHKKMVIDMQEETKMVVRYNYRKIANLSVSAFRSRESSGLRLQKFLAKHGCKRRIETLRSLDDILRIAWLVRAD